MNTTPILRREQHVARSPQPRLFKRAWIPSEASRAMLIVHGLGEHSGSYEKLASWFAQRGFVVFAFDQRGHGLSGGARNDSRRFRDFLDDLADMIGTASGECVGLPLYLVGHDLGSLVSALFLQERNHQVSGALLSGMPIARRKACSGTRALYEGLLATMLPRLRLRAQSTRAIQQLRARDMGPPFLLLYAQRDPLFDSGASERFTREAPQGQLQRYPGPEREIFQGPGHEAVFADMLAWLNDREETWA